MNMSGLKQRESFGKYLQEHSWAQSIDLVILNGQPTRRTVPMAKTVPKMDVDEGKHRNRKQSTFNTQDSK
jgi:hypothetical protein